MELILSTEAKEYHWPCYREAIDYARHYNRWSLSLNVGRVLISPHTVWGMNVLCDVPYFTALRIAKFLMLHSDGYLVYRQGNSTGTVSVRWACAPQEPDEVQLQVFETPDAAIRAATRWRKYLTERR